MAGEGDSATKPLYVLAVDAGGFSVTDDAAHALRVTIAAGGAGTGGTSSTDKTALTPGTAGYTPAGGLRDDTAPSTLAEGEGGIVRLTEHRAFHINLRNAAGAEVAVAKQADVEAVRDRLPTALGPNGGLKAEVLGVVEVSNDTGNPVPVSGTVTVANPTANPETGLAKEATLEGVRSAGRAASQVENLGGSTNAGGVWTALTPTAGRRVKLWHLRCTGSLQGVDVGLGVQAAHFALDPGDAAAPPFNGTVYVRTKNGVASAVTFEAVALEE